jgi:Immunoglobulin I-set domain
LDGLGEVYRLNLQPEFAQEPVTQIVANGASVTFSAGLFGIGPFSFQWLSNNIPIVGATNGTLTLPNAAAGAAGTYSVSVSNFWGAATSSVSSATVFSVAGAVNGAFTLNFINPPGATTRIWAATNLVCPNWAPVYTNSTGGTWQFTDSLMCQQRFYHFSTP